MIFPIKKHINGFYFNARHKKQKETYILLNKLKEIKMLPFNEKETYEILL